MKKGIVVLILSIFLASCDLVELNVETETIIDWIDFVKINNQEYWAHSNLVISDASFIGGKVGEVTFNVDKNVKDTNYQIKNGDAAYLDEGTALYSVKNMPNVIAVQDEFSINGYRIYELNDVEQNINVDFQKLAISKIEIYESLDKQPYYRLNNELVERKEIDTLISVLDEGIKKIETNNYSEEGPLYYDIVFYTDEPLASIYPLYKEDKWYWIPWEVEGLADNIATFIK